jgi:hypothetical protein
MTSDGQKSYNWEILIISSITFAFPSVLFYLARQEYISDSFIDRRLGLLRADETKWLVLLMALPLLTQLVSMLYLLFSGRRDKTADRFSALTFKAKLLSIPTWLFSGRRDKALNRFYGLCLITMSICSSSYCWLWFKYTTNQHDSGSLSYVALSFVAALVMVVGYVTFLIMRSPEWKIRHVSYLLTEDDIRDNKGSFCTRLQIAKEAQNSPAYLVKVFDSLGNEPNRVGDPRLNLIDAVTTNQFDNVHLTALVNRLNNNVIKHGNFFDARDIEEMNSPRRIKKLWYELHDGQLNLSQEQQEFQSGLVNRLLLEACFDFGVISPVIKDTFRDDLKTGLTKAPFTALVFFFTIFLGVSYLFGLAFAFDDQANLTNEGQPALFMARSHASRARSNPSIATPVQQVSLTLAGRNVNAPSIRSISWPEYTFYLESPASSLVYDDRNFNFEDYDRLLDEGHDLSEAKEKLRSELNSMGWIPGKLPRGIGYGNLREIQQNRMEKIKEIKKNEVEIAKFDERLLQTTREWKSRRNFEQTSRILSAIEDEALQSRGVLLKLKVNLEARTNDTPGLTREEEEIATKLKYALLEKLAQSANLPRQIEWFYLPSNKLPTITEEKVADPENEVTTFDSLFKDSLLAQLQKKHHMLKYEIDRASQEHKRLSANDKEWLQHSKERLQGKEDWLQRKLVELKRLVARRTSSYDEDGDQDKLLQTIAILQESRQVLEAKAGSAEPEFRNTVTVSISPIRDIHQFIPLSLMDYMYFTIYTITTTGYGDIVPTTTYAKFLCSLANILEVFFLVVFFNALISAKRQVRI